MRCRTDVAAVVDGTGVAVELESSGAFLKGWYPSESSNLVEGGNECMTMID